MGEHVADARKIAAFDEKMVKFMDGIAVAYRVIRDVGVMRKLCKSDISIIDKFVS